MTWERFSEGAVKVLLALVPSLFRVLWEHWPKTPAERRAHDARSSDAPEDGAPPKSPI